jgi:hypothetical protein
MIYTKLERLIKVIKKEYIIIHQKVMLSSKLTIIKTFKEFKSNNKINKVFKSTIKRGIWIYTLKGESHQILILSTKMNS